MSLFGSLTTAVSGLNAQQESIGNISNNIANSQTVGYKQVDTAFSDLVTESSQNYNGPGGVLAQPVYQNNIAGTVAASQTATNLSISGQGFFTVKAPPGTNGNTLTFANQDLYTRRGDFTLNSAGYLVNGAGYYLEGYPVDPTTKVANTASVAPIQVSQLNNSPIPTSVLDLAANLPSSYALTTDAGYTAPAPVSLQVYDAQGNPHTLSVQFNHTAANTWTASISAAGSQPTTDAPYQLTFQFGDGTTALSDGTVPSAGTLLSITDNTATQTLGTGQTLPTGTVGVSTNAVTNDPATITLPFNFGSGTQSIQLNTGDYASSQGLTEFADTAVDVQSFTQNGIARGTFQSVTIDANGYVDLNYSNGQTLSYFQLPVAQFNAPNQLQSMTGGSFAQTVGSGTASLGAPGAQGAGTIDPSTLEGSNVDIATEFTKLITAQQAYSSNAKVITTVNQLLQTVINLVQG